MTQSSLSSVGSRADAVLEAGSRTRRVVALICVALVLVNWCGAEEFKGPLERSVKAAFLYRFTEFVTWPETLSTSAPFVIAVVGSDGMVEELRQIVTGRLIHGRPVELRRLSAGDSLDGAQLIFIGEAERRHLSQIIGAAPRDALVVTESEGALAQGSVINFVIAGGRVRFEIALNSAARQGVRLSSRLLSVALAVHTEPP